jgi:hypothetical protein
MKTTKFIKFDGVDDVTWPAADSGKTWNGWAIPRVEPRTRISIAAWFERDEDADDDGTALVTADELRALPVDEDGLVTIDLGLCFAWAEPPADVFLVALAAKEKIRAIARTRRPTEEESAEARAAYEAAAKAERALKKAKPKR